MEFLQSKKFKLPKEMVSQIEKFVPEIFFRENYNNLPENLKNKIIAHKPFNNARKLALSLESLDNLILEAKLEKIKLKKNNKAINYPIYSMSQSVLLKDSNFDNLRTEVYLAKQQLIGPNNLRKHGVKSINDIDKLAYSDKKPKRSSSRSPRS